MELKISHVLLALGLLFCVCAPRIGAASSLPVQGSFVPPPPPRSYKILMLLPVGPPSHRNCFIPLAEGLASRGHKVVILSGLQPKSKHPNVREVNHGIGVMNETTSMFEVREKDPTKGFGMFKVILPKLARELYENPDVKELYEKRSDFDLFIIDELFNEPAYPFLEGAKYASIGTAGHLPVSSSIMGNVLNPSYIPAITVDYSRPYSILQRFSNLFAHLFMPIFWRKFEIFPEIEKEFSARFPQLPSLAEIEKGHVLSLANTHFSLDFAMPILPSQIEVGGMHCHAGKELPHDIKSFIDGSGPDGVIYFSLGSVCKGSTIPPKYKRILIEAFGQVKQRVIWKFEEEFKDLPNNIFIQHWLPQQDILAHPKVKLFITHGGLLSMQESIFHGKPLLALPVFGDQEKNGQRIANKGFGHFLLWENLSVESLVSNIKEIIDNPNYKTTVATVSASFRDQPISPLDTAIWWTEYVIRHDGAPQLRSPAADLSWMEYLNIDIMIGIHVLVFAAYCAVKKLIRCVASLCSSSNANKLKKQ